VSRLDDRPESTRSDRLRSGPQHLHPSTKKTLNSHGVIGVLDVGTQRLDIVLCWVLPSQLGALYLCSQTRGVFFLPRGGGSGPLRPSANW
jgi:hypothetical protein